MYWRIAQIRGVMFVVCNESAEAQLRALMDDVCVFVFWEVVGGKKYDADSELPTRWHIGR